MGFGRLGRRHRSTYALRGLIASVRGLTSLAGAAYPGGTRQAVSGRMRGRKRYPAMGYQMRHVRITHGRASCLTLGVIDEEARTAYTEGQCHALAMALHEANGWTLYEAGYDGWCCPAHWVVKTPDGLYVDIEGAHTYEETLGAWGLIRKADTDRWDEVNACCYLVPDLDAASAFVQAVTDYAS